MEPSPNRREREREKLRKLLKKSRSVFFKNSIHDIRLIEKQFRSNETNRGSPKILKEILIDRKQFGLIENLEKHLFRKNNLIFENTPQSIEYKK